MSEKIEPALTAEEWERYLPALKFDAGTRDLNIENAVHAFGPHAGAALALYGQPFGFTREDVKNLREDVLANAIHDGGTPEWIAWLESLIARIEALLPPEPAPTDIGDASFWQLNDDLAPLPPLEDEP